MLVAIVLLLTSTVCLAQLPDYIHVCKRNDPEIEKCILKSIEELRPKLKSGIEEIDVPPLEPLYLPEIELANGQDATKLKIYGRDIKIHGPSDFVVNDLKFIRDVPTKPEIRVNLGLKHMEMDGEYDLTAKLVLIPLNGKGRIRVNVSDALVDVTVHGQFYKKQGKEYLRFIKADMEFTMRDIDIALENLFNNDPTIAQIANRIIKDNKAEIAKTLNPVLARAVSKVLLEIANKITAAVDYDTLFPL